jgi:Protein of unknown function (DUF4231)
LSQPAGPEVSPEEHQDQLAYAQLVENEILRLDRGARGHLWGHYGTRVVVVACGATVPVLASIDSMPRIVFAILGAVAVVTETVAQLFQFQPHAVNQLHTRNALERELNRFTLGVRPYDAPEAVRLFNERIEDIREAADQASIQAWQKSTVPVQQPSSRMANQP